MNYSKDDILFLKNNYPKYGKIYCAEKLNRSEGSIRTKTYELGLKLDINSSFFKEFQNRARLSKIGKKRPEQGEVFKKLHKEGRLLKTIEQKKEIGIRIKKYIEDNGHPKGMKGKKHSEETKNTLSIKSKEFQKNFTFKKKQEISDKIINTKLKNGTYLNSCRSTNAFSRTKSGKRQDLNNQFFRSGTEANFARFLKFKGFEFEFEKQEFEFKLVKKGTRFYIPDFYIPLLNIYYEVKGWLDDNSITKLKRFKKYYPLEFSKLYLVKQGLNKKDLVKILKIGFTMDQLIDFKFIEKLKGIIPNWE